MAAARAAARSSALSRAAQRRADRRAVGAAGGFIGGRLTKGKEAVIKEGTEFGVYLNQSISLPSYKH